MINNADLKMLLTDYGTKSEDEIMHQANSSVIDLAQEVYATVPAYSDYIAKNNAHDIFNDLTIETFANLPLTDKQEYLRQYKRSDLTPNSQFAENAWVISATSGSTGEPFYFPRNEYQDCVYAASAEAYLQSNFDIKNRKTLYIVAFPMGVWIGGVFTYSALYSVAKNSYPISIITPGINKIEIIRVIKNLGPEYDQIIIGSYAPFLKDILDDGEQQGIDWKSLPVKFIFSAEAFSEEFREYLELKTGINQYLDTLNHYGTVDLGTMAHETPYAILIRKLAYKNKQLFKELFGEIARTPTLAQYDPRLFYFEEFNEGELCCSAKTGYPLLRYNLHDRGGIRSKKYIDELFMRHGINLLDEAKQVGIEHTIWNLPFVFVYERSDFSISYYAFQIYPEVIRKSLLSSTVEAQVTGKFTMNVDYVDGRQVLQIFVETRPGLESNDDLLRRLDGTLHDALYDASSEYRQTCDQLGIDQVRPRINLIKYEDPTYFRPGGKQKWVIK